MQCFQNPFFWTSLVVQWFRICLPVQGTWVQSLVWEDPTCCRATKSVNPNYWAWTLEPCSTTREVTPRRSCTLWWRVALARSNWRKPSHSNEDSAQPEEKKKVKINQSCLFIPIKWLLAYNALFSPLDD